MGISEKDEERKYTHNALQRSEGCSQYTHKWPYSPNQAYQESSLPGISNPIAWDWIQVQFLPPDYKSLEHPDRFPYLCF